MGIIEHIFLFQATKSGGCVVVVGRGSLEPESRRLPIAEQRHEKSIFEESFVMQLVGLHSNFLEISRSRPTHTHRKKNSDWSVGTMLARS